MNESFRVVPTSSQRVVPSSRVVPPLKGDYCSTACWRLSSSRGREPLDARVVLRWLPEIAELVMAGTKQWINVRTSESYSKTHVVHTAAVWRGHFTDQPRPRFRDAYNEIADA